MEHFLNKLKTRLLAPLPGREVQYRMAPGGRRLKELEAMKVSTIRDSAVMILFCTDEQGDLFVPLIERHAYAGVHSGQISLPGGKFEAGDADLAATARRECYEEIGISNLEILGRLSTLLIPVSGFMVHPYVGFSSEVNPLMTAQEREVKSLLRLYVSDLLNNNSIENGHVQLPDGTKIKAPFFKLEQHKIWGATAMILSELKEMISG